MMTALTERINAGPPAMFKQLVEIIRDKGALTDVIGDVDDRPLDELRGGMQDDFNVDVHKLVASLIGSRISLRPTRRWRLCVRRRPVAAAGGRVGRKHQHG